ncbi:MAG: TrbJ/VirB5 family protein [Gammaproteobacteria bacterium]
MGKRRFWKACLVSVFWLVCLSRAHALASGSTVFDPFNFIRNTVTALNSIRSVEWEVESYLVQYESLRTEIKSLKNLPPEVLASLGNVTDVNQSIAQYESFLNALRGTAGSLRAGYGRVMRINRELSTARLGWAQYSRMMRQGVAQRQKVAMIEIHQDDAILRSIHANYQRLRAVESELPEASSMKGQLQTLNATLGVVAGEDNSELAVMATIERSRSMRQSESLAADQGWMVKHRSLDRRAHGLGQGFVEANRGPGLGQWLSSQGSRLKPVIPAVPASPHPAGSGPGSP